MRIESLWEFVVFSKYLNLTKAASELHLSQPNLGRHLKNLEAELGFSLLKREGTNFTLTPAGEHYLARVSEMLTEHSKIVSECAALSEQKISTIKAMQHYYNDEGSRVYYSLLFAFHQQYPFVIFHYANPYRQDPLAHLRDGLVDIVLTYAADELVISNMLARHLSSISLSIWCAADSPLAKRETCTMEDLRTAKIVKPNDANAPFYVAFENLCQKHDVVPQFQIVSTRTQTEFYSMRINDDTVYVIPSAMKDDQRVGIQTNKVLVPFELPLHEYMVCREEPLGDFDFQRLMDFELPE